MIKNTLCNWEKIKNDFQCHREKFLFYIAVFTTLLLLCLFIFLSFFTAQERQFTYTEEMRKAASLADTAMNAIKEERLSKGEIFADEDILSTGLVEKKGLTAISTTDGDLIAKRTSCNSDWAALTVRMFKKAGLNKGDEIGIVFSGSFPAINICVLAAAESYGLKYCLMESFGASTHGATNVDFTFFDMTEYLVDREIFSHRADVISFGGNNDVGSDFRDEDGILVQGTRTAEEVRTILRERAKASSSLFLEEEDFVKNIDARLDVFQEKVPNLKFFINAGGSQTGIGKGSNSYLDSGYKKASSFTYSRIPLWQKTGENGGFLNYFSSCGIDVMNYLNIKGLAEKYGISIDPKTQEEKESGKVYIEQIISPIFPILTTIMGIGGITMVCIYGRKEKIQRQKAGKLYFPKNKKE